jgi:Tfp pilus assembly protein PilO
MSARDRLVLMAIAAFAVVGAVWMLAVSPARKQASALAGEVASVQGQLSGVKGELAGASEVRARYGAAYASLVTLGKAVPTADEVPGLMYAIDQAANHKKVQFTSISNGSASGGHSSSSSSAASSTAQGSGLHQLPFTFTFSGSYQDLCLLLAQLEGFTVQGRSGTLKVSGRLLTIQGITLGGAAGSASAGGGAQAGKPGVEMTWTITASAYVLPASTSSGSGGTPAGAQPSGPATTPTSSPGGAAPTAPAVVKVSP